MRVAQVYKSVLQVMGDRAFATPLKGSSFRVINTMNVQYFWTQHYHELHVPASQSSGHSRQNTTPDKRDSKNRR